MNWTSLLESKYAADAFIKGHFFVIKFTPDIVVSYAEETVQVNLVN